MVNAFDKEFSSDTITPKPFQVTGSLSSEVQEWTKQYYLNVVRYLDGVVKPADKSFVQPLTLLNFEDNGDYSGQIDQLNQTLNFNTKENSENTLAGLYKTSRRTILLGKTGCGRTSRLKELLLQQARLNLTGFGQFNALPLNEIAMRWPDNPPVLPVYLDLGEWAKTQPVIDTNQTSKTDLLRDVLDNALNKFYEAPIPANLFYETVPLVLIDNLELLDATFAPSFLYLLNQWSKQVAPNARLIITCHYLNFVLYHPWFKADQQWQFYSINHFDWNQVRTTLAEFFPDTELQKLELAGIARLLTFPSLYTALYRSLQRTGQSENIKVLLEELLKVLFDNNPDNAHFLSLNSTLLNPSKANLPHSAGESPEPAQVADYNKEYNAKATGLGIIEKHPVAGWIRLADPGLDWILAAWVCREATG